MTPTTDSDTIWATLDRLLVHRKAERPLNVLDVLSDDDQQSEVPTPRRRLDILDVLATS